MAYLVPPGSTPPGEEAPLISYFYAGCFSGLVASFALLSSARQSALQEDLTQDGRPVPLPLPARQVHQLPYRTRQDPPAVLPWRTRSFDVVAVQGHLG